MGWRGTQRSTLALCCATPHPILLMRSSQAHRCAPLQPRWSCGTRPAAWSCRGPRACRYRWQSVICMHMSVHSNRNTAWQHQHDRQERHSELGMLQTHASHDRGVGGAWQGQTGSYTRHKHSKAWPTHPMTVMTAGLGTASASSGASRPPRRASTAIFPNSSAASSAAKVASEYREAGSAR